jgi:uncharacterized protein (TIGR02145 family)
MKKNFLLIIAVVFSTILTAQQTGTFTDSRDGKSYKTVKIGNQVWMAENLNYKTSSGSWCYYGKSTNCDKYARLYNWETAKSVCPSGWHLPSQKEFKILLNNYGGEGKEAYIKLRKNGVSGFEALDGGWCDSYGYSGLNETGDFISSSISEGNYVYRLYFTNSDNTVQLFNSSKNFGYSVRCIKD